MINSDAYRPAVNDPNRHNLRKGTSEYYAYWSEQHDRCINGYTPPGGTYITGPYYFYLNFCTIDVFKKDLNRKVPGSPLYRDQDHEYFNAIAEVEREQKGLIVLKARRKGFSFNNVGLLLHEWSFFQGSSCAVASENEDYVKDFRKRVMQSYNKIDPKFKLKMMTGGGDELDSLVSGYKVKVEGEWKKEGFLSEMHFRLAKNENCFRGLTLKYMLVEESGEVKKLKKLLSNSEECFREGAHQFGIPIIGGTSNQISHDNKDFQELFFNPEAYNLKALFIPATKVYAGFFDMSTGKSDMKGAEVDIKKRRAKVKKDKLRYYTLCQEMPIDPKDAFVSFGSGAFDLEKINDQKAFLLTDSRAKKVIRGNLEWPRAENGKMIVGAKPKFVRDDEGAFEFVEDFMDPVNFQYAYVAGVDSYYINDEFEEKGTTEMGEKSNGSMFVYLRFIGVNQVGDIPVAKYRDRPPSKDIFAENCYKLAAYFDCQILVEYTDDYFLKYFDMKNAMRFIKERPQASDAPYGKATNRYGVHMKVYQKNLVSDLLEEYVRNHIDNIFFVSLLEELAKFGKENTDEAMAFGMSLMHNMDLVHLVSKPKEEEKEELLFSYVRNDDGSITYISGSMSGGSKAPTLDYDL